MRDSWGQRIPVGHCHGITATCNLSAAEPEHLTTGFTSAPLSLTTLLGSHAVLTYQDQARMSMSAGYVAMLLLQSIFGNSRLSAGHIFGLLKTAFLCLVVGLLEAIAIATALAERKTDVKPSREILGLGLANLASAAFMGCPATGSFARSAVNKDAGAASGEIAATCCGELHTLVVTDAVLPGQGLMPAVRHGARPPARVDSNSGRKRHTYMSTCLPALSCSLLLMRPLGQTG